MLLALALLHQVRQSRGRKVCNRVCCWLQCTANRPASMLRRSFPIATALFRQFCQVAEVVCLSSAAVDSELWATFLSQFLQAPLQPDLHSLGKRCIPGLSSWPVQTTHPIFIVSKRSPKQVHMRRPPPARAVTVGAPVSTCVSWGSTQLIFCVVWSGRGRSSGFCKNNLDTGIVSRHPTYTYIYIYIHISRHPTYVCISLSLSLYIYIYNIICMYVCIYAYIYIFTHMSVSYVYHASCDPPAVLARPNAGDPNVPVISPWPPAQPPSLFEAFRLVGLCAGPGDAETGRGKRIALGALVVVGSILLGVVPFWGYPIFDQPGGKQVKQHGCLEVFVVNSLSDIDLLSLNVGQGNLIFQATSRTPREGVFGHAGQRWTSQCQFWPPRPKQRRFLRVHTTPM